MSATTQQIGGTWTELRGKLRETWGALTDSDLDRFEGQLDQLVGHIERNSGETRSEVASKIQRLARDVKYRF